MKASEYIKRLQELVEKHGDLDVVSICEDYYYNRENPEPKYVNKESYDDFDMSFKEIKEAFALDSTQF